MRFGDIVWGVSVVGGDDATGFFNCFGSENGGVFMGLFCNVLLYNDSNTC